MSSPPAYTLSSPPPYPTSPLVRYWVARSPASQVSSISEASSVPSEMSSGSDVSVNPTTPEGSTLYCAVSDSESDVPSTPLDSSSSVEEGSEYESDRAETPIPRGRIARSTPVERLPGGQRFHNPLHQPSQALSSDAAPTLWERIQANSLALREDVDMSPASSVTSESEEHTCSSMTEGIETRDGRPVRDAIDNLLTADGERLRCDLGEGHYPAESYHHFVRAWHDSDARRTRATLQRAPYKHLEPAAFDRVRVLVAEAEYDLARHVSNLVKGMDEYFGAILQQRQEALDNATAEAARLTKTLEVASHSFHAVVTETHDLQAQLAAESARRHTLESMLAAFRENMGVAMATGLKRPLEQTLAP